MLLGHYKFTDLPDFEVNEKTENVNRVLEAVLGGLRLKTVQRLIRRTGSSVVVSP